MSIDVLITNSHMANRLYAELKKAPLQDPENSQPLEIQLRSGRFSLTGEEAKRIWAILQGLDKKDGYDDGYIAASAVSGHINPPHVQLTGARYSREYQANLPYVKKLVRQERLARTLMLPPDLFLWIQDDPREIAAAAIVLTENDMTPHKFRSIAGQCLQDGLKCYYSLDWARLGKLLQAEIIPTHLSSMPTMRASVMLCLGCENAEKVGPTQWRHIARHEGIHGWAAMIAAKWGTKNVYEALKMWAKGIDKKYQVLFTQVELSLQNWKGPLPYVFEEGFDVSVLKLYAPPELLESEKSLLLDFLKQTVLSDAGDNDAKTEAARLEPDPKMRCLRHAKEIYAAYSLEIPAWEKAKDTYLRLYPEDKKDFNHYFEVFALIDSFFTQELGLLAKIYPNRLKKIK